MNETTELQNFTNLDFVDDMYDVFNLQIRRHLRFPKLCTNLIYGNT